jgi:hypothetical protein
VAGKQAIRKMNKIASFPFLASLSCLYPFASFSREVLAVLEDVGATADPVRGEDKVVAIAAAVVVTVTPVLAQHTHNRKAQHLLVMVYAKNATKRSKPRTPEKQRRSSHHADLAA